MIVYRMVLMPPRSGDIYIPKHAEILHVEAEETGIHFWYAFDDTDPLCNEMHPRHIYVVPTGGTYYPPALTKAKHLRTVTLTYGVFHIFEGSIP